jgi:hypothetical protein
MSSLDVSFSAAVPSVRLELVWPIQLDEYRGILFLPDTSPSTTLGGHVQEVPRVWTFFQSNGKSEMHYLVRLAPLRLFCVVVAEADADASVRFLSSN